MTKLEETTHKPAARRRRPARRGISRAAREILPRLQRSPVVADTIPRHLRALDLAILVLLLPPALLAGAVLAVAVVLDSPGPVLFRARRIGRGGRPFAMIKFRTMRHAAEGPPLSVRGDTRYTPLGRTLAATRLDELPQLWNVLRGDMRLVGPRPEIQEFVEAFPEEYEQILSVPPGLTGPAQLRYAKEGRELARVADRVAYYRHELLPKKVSIDLTYAERHSAMRDLRLLVGTLLLPLRQTVAATADAQKRRVTRRSAPSLLAALTLVSGLMTLIWLVVAEAGTPL